MGHPSFSWSFLPQLAAGKLAARDDKGKVALPFGVMVAMTTSQALFIESFRGVQDQFLYSPIQQLAYIELMLRRAGHFVNPAELLELLA